MPETTSVAGRFVAHLQELANRRDRGPLAALRRSLSASPASAFESYPYVIPWLPEDRSTTLETAFFLVAGLFATHPQSDPDSGNFGQAFGLLREKSISMERRFVALLSSPWEDLREHLRHAVTLLRAAAVPIDYGRLLEDLIRWNAESRSVQRAWARSFWRETAVPQNAAATALNPIPQTTKE
jgi:CRISPR system Cascade subunit CasB